MLAAALLPRDFLKVPRTLGSTITTNHMPDAGITGFVCVQEQQAANNMQAGSQATQDLNQSKLKDRIVSGAVSSYSTRQLTYPYALLANLVVDVLLLKAVTHSF